MDLEIAAGFDASFGLNWHFYLRQLDFDDVRRHAFIIGVDGMSGGGGGAYDVDLPFERQGRSVTCLSLRPGLVAITGVAPKARPLRAMLHRSAGEPIPCHLINVPRAQVDAFLCFSPLDADSVRLTWGSHSEDVPVDLADFE